MFSLVKLSFMLAHAIAADRLWIQRPLPKPSRKNLKRKAVDSPANRKAKSPRVDKQMRTKSKPSLQSRLAADASKGDRSLSRSTRSQHRSQTDEPLLPTANSRARAAKTKANVKLDLQARQLAAAKAEMEALERHTASRSPKRARSIGTRKSKRLQTSESDDDWQQIPPEWLCTGSDTETAPANQRNNPSARQRRGSGKTEQTRAVNSYVATLDSDDSDLTELSDDEPSPDRDLDLQGENSEEIIPHENATAKELDQFNEWETVSLTSQHFRFNLDLCEYVDLCFSARMGSGGRTIFSSNSLS